MRRGSIGKFRTGVFQVALACACSGILAQEVQFVFTSDAHYGTVRKAFRGRRRVDAQAVNEALVAGVNALQGLTLPADGGVGAGQPVGAIDFLVEGGDICNRQEKGAQSAALSWVQFRTDYIEGLAVKDGDGRKAPLFLIPGNHDADNAAKDATPMMEIYNHMTAPVPPRTAGSFRPAENRIHYSRTFGGTHFVFISLWPDRIERSWLEKDLQAINPATPVILFAHDPPGLPAKGDMPTDDPPGEDSPEALTRFLKAHPNITAWFHGHANWNEAYDWTGADGTLALHTFRVDSPMKGRASGQDERKLSFQLVTLDARNHRMTVRECLWNAGAQDPGAPVAFGTSTTVSLAN